MTQEEKQLLLKDLCARLPYGVICKRFENAYELVDIDIKRGLVYLLRGEQYVPYSITYGDEVKPYLRPMSSMTEAEIEELKELTGTDEVKRYGFSYSGLIGGCFGMMYDDCSEIVDWLNAHHFDYRGLIGMGLALEAPSDMYSTKQ